MKEVTKESETGKYIFITETNSIYELYIESPQQITLTRLPDANNENVLRKDEEGIKVIGEFKLQVGSSAVFPLEPLGTNDINIRQTSIVISIEKQGMIH